MALRKIDIQSALPTLQELLVAVKEGTEVLFTEGDIPLARLMPAKSPSIRTAGLHKGAMQMSDDFDAPLPDSFWLGDQ